MTISERISRNARYICHYQGKNVGDMEKAVGVSAGYLSRVKGKAMLPIDTGYAFAAYLGVSMDELGSVDVPALAKQARIAELKAELAELEGEETCSTR